MSFKFPLATSSWDLAEVDAMHRVIASGRFTMGPEVAALERDFAAWVGSGFCVMVNSGSSANLLMTAALFYTREEDRRLRPGDEVLVPAVSWSTTYYPLHQYGLKLRFVDIDLRTLNANLDALERAVTSATRAVMAVNLLGNPLDYDRLTAFCRARGLVLLEDNCESMGAELNGRKAGTFGLMGSFSTFFSHHISTMEGGFVVTDDPELHQILLSLRAHGWTRDLPNENLVCGAKSDDPFYESFRFVLPGYNVRPLELSGAIGVEQVRKLPRLIAARRANAALFAQALEGHPDLLIQEETGASSWFGFSLILKPGAKRTRAELLAELERRGFECRPIVAGNFAANDVVKYFDSSISGGLANAEHLDANGLFVGNHPYPIPEAMDALRGV